MSTDTLRTACADILEGLAQAHTLRRPGSCYPDPCPAPAWFRGAETLRHVEASELDPEGGCTDDEIYALEMAIDNYDSAIAQLRHLTDEQASKATALTPAKFRDAVAEIVNAL